MSRRRRSVSAYLFLSTYDLKHHFMKCQYDIESEFKETRYQSSGCLTKLKNMHMPLGEFTVKFFYYFLLYSSLILDLVGLSD